MKEIPPDECCVCLAAVVELVPVEQFRYPFCKEHQHRADFLLKGRDHHWPALEYYGITETYAIDSSPQAYVLSALFGTDDRVVELLDAIDEFIKREQVARELAEETR